MKKISIYSDGGCRIKNNVKGNKVSSDDKSAYAFKIEENGETLKIHGEAMYGQTNNKMELTAFIEALKWLDNNNMVDYDITAYLDSNYVLSGVKSYMKGWKENGWKRSGGQLLANLEEWKEVDRLLSKFSNITYEWVKSHSDVKGNNEVDKFLNMKMDELS